MPSLLSRKGGEIKEVTSGTIARREKVDHSKAAYFIQAKKKNHMSTFIEELVGALDEEAQAHHDHYREFSKRAEEMAYPQIAKFFRAMIVAEAARVNLYRECLTSSKCMEACDYYLCPKCGVALAGDVLDKCPVCETPGSQFERIS